VLLKSLKRRLGDDRGAALAAVIGMMMISLLTATIVVSAVTTTTAFTTTSRAGVQSQAAAEAGIAATRAGLIAGTCTSRGGVYENVAGETPEYFATVWIPSGSSWIRACPVGTAYEVRILSTGYAAAEGVVASGRDETSLEAILSTVVTPAEIVASGPAVYAYRSDGFGGSGTLVSVNNSSPSVLVKQGDVSCSGASSGPADWVIDNGSLTISGSCNILGNAWASNSAILSGGVTVSGNVVANAISASGSSIIGGSAWSTTSITLSGGGTYIGANATAASLTMNSSTLVKGSAWVYGNTYMDWGSEIKGKLTTKTRSGPQGKVGSQQLYSPSTPPASPYLTPARPFVPDWVDFAYDTNDWPGFTFVTLSGTCNDSAIAAAFSTIGTNQGLIDARACAAQGGRPAGTFSMGGSNKYDLKNDVAIVANNFDLQGSAGFTASAARRLWLIIPDEIKNKLPDCPASGNQFGIGGSFSFSNPISTMIYTPCPADIASGIVIRGQLFAGYAEIGGSAQLGYIPIGLPGYNLSTGEDTNIAATEAQRVLVSLRNVEDGN
jgi:cytoskeletal protein CcmA (bactofilin family)